MRSKQGRSSLSLGQWIIIIIFNDVIIAFGIATYVILTNQGITQGSPALIIISIIFSVVVSLLTLMFTIFQWRFPVTRNIPEQSIPSSFLSPIQQSNAHNPTVLPMLVPPQSPPYIKTSYRGILGLPPPTDPKTIQQREKAVKEIYTKLTQSDITAIALTGIGGVGKSTLAALIYRYTEEQRQAGNGFFTAESLWLTIDQAVTMADLAGTIIEALGKPMLDLSTLSPQNQAVALFNILNTIDKPRLVILDQFENLLDPQEQHALPDRLGIDEWIDAINSQKCICRVLLTSRLFSQGSHKYPSTYMQEFPVAGLEKAEGIELLHKQGVKGTETELSTAIERCEGHAFALTLLASLLNNRNLSLRFLFSDPAYTHLWTGNIAHNLLDSIYMEQLDHVQRKLLVQLGGNRARGSDRIKG